MRGKKKLCLRFVWWFQRKSEKQGDESSLDCVEVLVDEFKKGGLIVERVIGLQNEFIKVCPILFFLSSLLIWIYVVYWELIALF